MGKRPLAGLWDVLCAIVGRLRDEFLLVTIAYLVVAVALGRLAPDVIDRLGRAFFYLIVVLAFLAYVVTRILAAYLQMRQPSQSTPQPLPPGAPEATQQPASPSTQRDHYLASLITECCRARLVGLDPQAADPTRGGLSLERLYVTLDTLTSVEEEPEKKERAVDRAGGRARPLSALEALARSPDGRAVLLGLPGTGKSTFVRYVALRMAQALRDPTLDLIDLLPGWQGGALMPLIVPLGRLAESLPVGARRGDSEMVERFVCQVLDADEHLRGYGRALLAEIRDAGGLLLFDGLDEVADLDRRPIVREAVEDFIREYADSDTSRCLVTCRTYSYNDSRWQLTGWQTHEIAPLDDAKIRQFVQAWHAELSRVDPARAEDYDRKCQKMLAALHPSDRRRLAEIAPNPLILTVMAVVHTHRGELPDARALVYKWCIDILLVRWETEREVLGRRMQKRSLLDALGVPLITLENALQEIAYRAHEGGHARDDGGQQGGAALVTEGLLTDVLQAALNDLGKVETFLRYCESANGLVMLQGVAPLPDAPPDAPPRRIYAFPHMTFEEYLAGRYLGRLPNLGAKVREHVDRSDRWREPVMLLGEHLCFEAGDFERVNAILERLTPARAPRTPTPEDWQAAWLAGDLLVIYRRALQGEPELDGRVVGRVRDLVETGALTPRERAAAGRTLAVLGDPRPGVGAIEGPDGLLLPDVQWCFVPPGPFLMGSRKEDDPEAWEDELPQHPYDIPGPYWISRYPVTNRQLRAFVDDPKGYRSDEWWTRAGLKWRGSRAGPDEAGGVFDLPNHPAVMITWYEAVAYCRWLTERLQGAVAKDGGPLLSEGWSVRLPTEAEWEKAARGGLEVPPEPVAGPAGTMPALSMRENRFPARSYPWGNSPDANCANYFDTGVGTTSAVGLFPDGVSPYGCLDMAGNVWEWCSTKWLSSYEDYGEREDNELEGGAHRVVRGGSFYFRQFVRCAVRLRLIPVGRDWSLGFRVVAAPVSGA